VDDAIESYRKVVKLDKNNYDAWYDYGCALLDGKNYDEALLAFESSSNNYPDWAEPFYERAKIFFIKGDIEKGLEMVEIGFRINPKDRFEFDFEKDWEKVTNFLMNR
jgi:tetratricopeptide (TPR) repeat protein